MRPGRLEKVFYIAAPDQAARKDILKVLTKRKHIAEDVNLDMFSQDEISGYYTGADLAAVVREAAMCAIRRCDQVIYEADFLEAFAAIPPSVSDEMLEQYHVFQETFGGYR